MDDYKEILSTIDNRSLVDKVETRMIEYFIKKELKPNDIIPKEIELAQAMGVSRTVIRESLNRLKTTGIIESIKHKGTIIKSPNLYSIMQKSLIPNILDDTTLKEIFEFRLVLEIGMADLVIKRITPEKIIELSAIVEDEPEKSESTLFDVDHEIKFHGKLYEITGNNTLKQFQSVLLPIFNFAYQSGLIDKPTSKKQYVSHKGLVEVLKDGNAQKFREAMRMHLENHFQRILE